MKFILYVLLFYLLMPQLKKKKKKKLSALALNFKHLRPLSIAALSILDIQMSHLLTDHHLASILRVGLG
jgi:hypothetical protein